MLRLYNCQQRLPPSMNASVINLHMKPGDKATTAYNWSPWHPRFMTNIVRVEILERIENTGSDSNVSYRVKVLTPGQERRMCESTFYDAAWFHPC